MMLPLHDRLRTAIRSALHTRFGLDRDAATIPLEVPPNRAFGDIGSPVAFELARELRKAPRVIAQELAGALGAMPGVAGVSAAPNGYLNVFLDRAAFLLERAGPEALPPGLPGLPKTIVEHTAINPNKAAHIGHLRNACLGDTLVRALRYRGTPVEVQNYIDDTGVQVADVVVGFRHLLDVDLAEVRRLADTTRFDYYCWDLYARVTEWYDGDPDASGNPRRHPPRHRARRRSDRRHRRPGGRSDRAGASRHHGAAGHRLPAAHLGGRHPAPAVLGPRLRAAQAVRVGVPAAGGPPDRVLGDAHRRGRRPGGEGGRRRVRRRARSRAGARGRSRHGGRRRAAREGHRPLQRHGHLRRQGHGVSVLEIRPARPGFPLPAIQHAHGRRHPVGHDQP